MFEETLDEARRNAASRSAIFTSLDVAYSWNSQARVHTDETITEKFTPKTFTDVIMASTNHNQTSKKLLSLLNSSSSKAILLDNATSQQAGMNKKEMNAKSKSISMSTRLLMKKGLLNSRYAVITAIERGTSKLVLLYSLPSRCVQERGSVSESTADCRLDRSFSRHIGLKGQALS